MAWENSNVGGIGSQEDLEQRIATAKSGHEWDEAGKVEGVQVYRIENFGVNMWPIERFGEFYAGDCYIVLQTHGHPRSLRWNVFYWIGSESTTDERGTAALKTIELDDLFGTLPVQYRETEGHESQKFLDLFENGIRIVKGGIDSGFRHVQSFDEMYGEGYQPKLFQCKGKRRVRCVEVPCQASALNKGDAFILDLGLKAYVWVPSKASHGERFKAAQVVQDMKNARKGRLVREFLDEDGNPEFWAALGGRPEAITEDDETQSDTDFDLEARGLTRKVLYRLCDESGRMEFTKEEESPPGGKLTRANLDHMDVFVIDMGPDVIAWIGSGASRDERKKAILYAHTYISMHNKPIWTRVTRIEQGREGEAFNELFQ